MQLQAFSSSFERRIMEQIKISAKVLGQMAMPDFCERCFFIKLHTKNLPWQIFPGIFSSIDAYTKKVVHHWIDRNNGFPEFLEYYGVTGYQKAPHWSKFNIDAGHGITLSGVVDDIWTCKDGIVIPDYKTAKFTANADKLLPMYKAQLNGYAKIATEIGMGPVVAIPLIYMEPQTEEEAVVNGGKWVEEIFSMAFRPHVLPLELDIESLDPLLERARAIYDGGLPDMSSKCKDCMALDGIVDLLA